MTPKDGHLPAIEAELRWSVALHLDGPPLLLGMICYHLGWVDQEFRPAQSDSGKRIRPALLLLAAESAGGRWERHYRGRGSGAVAQLHTLHDDIEDPSPYEGAPTLGPLGIPRPPSGRRAVCHILPRALPLQDHAVPPERVLSALQRYTEPVIGITRGSVGLASRTRRRSTWPRSQVGEGKTARLSAWRRNSAA